MIHRSPPSNGWINVGLVSQRVRIGTITSASREVSGMEIRRVPVLLTTHRAKDLTIELNRSNVQCSRLSMYSIVRCMRVVVNTKMRNKEETTISRRHVS